MHWSFALVLYIYIHKITINVPYHRFNSRQSLSVRSIPCNRTYFNAPHLPISSLSESGATGTQQFEEGASEVVVEDGVDDRVERRVAVAGPEHDCEDEVWDGEAEEGGEEVGAEEGQPARHERQHDDAQHKRGASFTRARNLALVSLGLVQTALRLATSTA